MELYSAAQVKEWDAYTIQKQNISISQLVERAATQATQYIQEHYTKNTPLVFFCGMGHNGADGLCMALQLLHLGYSIKVFVVQHKPQASSTQKQFLNQLLKLNASLVDFITTENDLPSISKNSLIIDALLGIGLNKPVEGILAKCILLLNNSKATILSIDIPSGLSADDAPASSIIINAQLTLTFQCMKRSFLHPETASYCGTIKLLDIGLSKEFRPEIPNPYSFNEPEQLATHIKAKHPFSYKYQNGNVLLVGASKGKSGAMIMAAQAALRSGVGLCQCAIPECAFLPLQCQVPECMLHSYGEHFIETKVNTAGYSALVVGMGMGTNEKSTLVLEDILETYAKPCVLDADALNLIAQQPSLLSLIPANSILTPHNAEFDRLFGKHNNSFERCESAKLYAQKYGVYILLKGHRSIIVSPNGKCYYNNYGNAGMAKAGSGDILSGLIGGLLAQGYDALHALQIGVLLHAWAGDIALKEYGENYMNCKECIEALQKAWKKLEKCK